MSQTSLQNTLDVISEIAIRRQAAFSQKETNRVEEVLQDMRETLLRVIFIGPFSSGKSSLLNRLIGKEVLPVSLPETTATSFRIRVIRKGQEEGIELPGGKRLPLSSINEVNTSQKQMVDVYIASDDLPAGFLFLDTPGISSVYEIHEKITIEALEKADVILLVVSATQGITKELLDFMNLHQRYAPKTYLILNQADLLLPDNREEALSHNQSLVSEMGIERVLLSSAKEEKGVDSLRDLLNELVPQAQAIKTKATSKRLTDLGKHILGTLAALRDSLKLDIQEIEEKIKESERKRTEILRNISKKTDDMMENIREAVRESLANFETKAYASVETYVNRVIESGSGEPFVAELRRLWDIEAANLQRKIREQISECKSVLSGSFGDVEVAFPWWAKWLDLGLILLTTIILPWGGLWTLLEGLAGKVISEGFKKTFVKGIVRNSLSTAVERVSSNMRKELNEKLDELRAEAKEHIANEMEPFLREVEDALSELKARKEKRIFDYEAEKKSLEEDISRLEKAIASLTA
ncbi:MAG: dynamin family protein [candidate division WOR-3 bacterium]